MDRETARAALRAAVEQMQQAGIDAGKRTVELLKEHFKVSLFSKLRPEDYARAVQVFKAEVVRAATERLLS
jgi:hypothetical protein